MAKDEDKKAHADDESHDAENEGADEEAAEGEVDEDGADGEHSDEDEDEDEESSEEPKPRAASPSKEASAPPARPRPIRAAEPPPPPPPAMGKRLAVFGVMLVVLTAGFYVLPASENVTPGAARWKPGQVVDVDITLVKEDATKLACGASTEIAGRKCEYSNKTDKNDVDDQHMLKPYTTVDQVQFLAAGLWSQAALAPGKLPTERFSIHCKYHVEGTVKSPLIRWDPKAQWGEKNPDWNAGVVSDCKLNTPQ